jgi:hypothetical protein
MSEKEILCELVPPRSIVEFDPRMISNGFLPDTGVGLLLVFSMWHLAGQTRQHAIWTGGYNDPSEGLVFPFPFLLKPGARDVIVDVVFDFVSESDSGAYQITAGILSNSVNKEVTYNVTGSEVSLLENARRVVFVLTDVGAYPGKLANRDEDAILTITGTGDNLRLWSVSYEQQHTIKILQDSP